jgi:hypothetical protein
LEYKVTQISLDTIFTELINDLCNCFSEIFALSGCQAAYIASVKFRDILSVPSSREKLYCSTLEDGTDRLSRNVCNYLLIYHAYYSKRAKIDHIYAAVEAQNHAINTITEERQIIFSLFFLTVDMVASLR